MKEIFSTEQIVQLMTILIQALAVFLAFVVKKYVIPYLKTLEASAQEKLGIERYQMVRSFVYEMVHFVENKYSVEFSQMGAQKKLEVIDQIQKVYPEFNETMLDAIIQNTVTEMKKNKAIEDPDTPQG